MPESLQPLIPCPQGTLHRSVTCHIHVQALLRILLSGLDYPHFRQYYHTLFEYKNMSNDFHASYISEYYHIIGQLFLSGYIDFMVDAPEETLLSKYL